ncbi:polyphosphate kinase 1 [Halorubrum sp. Ib24]|uniref:polyphosphate kinase 1 n=1 Tax=unclassified Halorubrum TaxID=2642239 RepID=UPI000B99A36E|nr:MULTISPECIES: polyphosphate kinase 1 [unclassified Halorubrum]OYR38991.1 polyphosphate kinase 1 [Halorubrum sp. Ib24]OYR42049.1 polyphosphate kinase 1 [Halorubrum sp. Eb13]OYR51040.1 polyphosphate kinase 1 [Halorubrum sp. Ea1]
MTDKDLTDPEYYLNRELSELAFQERVLREGMDDRNLPLERLRFLAFFTKNTDEFFMKRVGGLKQQIDAGVTETTPDGRTPKEQWVEVLDTARPLFRQQSEYWQSVLKPTLADEGIEICTPNELPTESREQLRTYFEESILPTLTPLAFDPAHPFPFISNLSLSLAVLSSNGSDEPTFTRIKIPPNQPRLITVSGEADRYVLIEDLIECNLDLLLPDIDIRDVSKFKVTRNAEVRRNEEVAEDLIDMVEEVIEQRRFATIVRLEVDADMPEGSLAILKDQLGVDDREVFHRKGPIDYEDFFELIDLDRPDLKPPSWSPKPHPRLGSITGDTGDETTSIFDEIKKGDILAHHPYHSFEGTVQRFLNAAATDPNVLAVKAAIYRTASDSKVIQSLINAAENGKQVAVMVELKARFDEKNNLEWVRQLEEEGIHVAYGTVGLKTHTKTALVVRQEDNGVQLYSHIGTGNYHSGTAKGYSDLGLLTADRDIGFDLTKVFNFFTGPTLDDRFRKLLIAPVTMRERFTEMVRREADHARAGRQARIVVKVNGLEDPSMVEELYRASMAGVEIDLIVRDICRLRPGIDGLSENVTVHSIVGRFLEHARIFYFENGGSPEWYIGSADWMTRNLDYRVEAVTPVEDIELRRQLRFILEASVTDNRRRWVMQSDGRYEQVSSDDEPVRDIQEILMAATEAAVDRGYGLGMVVDTELIDSELLVEDVEGGGADSGFEGSNGDDPDAEEKQADPDGGEISVFDAHADRWYRPDSETYDWAVRTSDGERRYFKTRDGARKRLQAEYE